MKTKLTALAIAALTLTATPVTFEWDHSPDPLVVRYRLYWGLGTNVYTANQTTANKTNAIEIADNLLTPNVPYYFTVVAMNAAGVESVPSNVVPYTNVVRPLPPGTLRVNVPPGSTATATITLTVP